MRRANRTRHGKGPRGRYCGGKQSEEHHVLLLPLQTNDRNHSWSVEREMQSKEMCPSPCVQRERLPRNAVVRSQSLILSFPPRGMLPLLHMCSPGTLVFALLNTTSSRRSLMPTLYRSTPKAILERQAFLLFLPRGLLFF